MKLVTTSLAASLAASALIVSLSGAAFAQVSLDPNAQGGAKTHTDRAKAGGSGSATTGAGVQTPGGNVGVGASGNVSGQGSAGGSTGGVRTIDPRGGASGKVRGDGTLGN